VETAEPLIDARGHKLVVAIPAEPIPMHADLVRLAQVIANLLTNAAKYTPKPGRIWLTADREGGEVVISVKDEGMGIAPDMLNRVFELFVQVDASPSRSQGGLGIGLTLVRRLIEMHEGTVTARSPGPGQGSEFIIRLPLGLAATSAGTASDGDGSHARRPAREARRVLIVDDNVDAADSVAMLLQAAGFSVRCVYDGMSALSVAHAFQPDIFVLDIGLPDITGYEVAKRLRTIPPFAHTPIVAVTGYGQESDRKRSREAGIDHHMTKPVDPDSLKAVLGAAI
jgi:CheY-like chemotaxis protein